MKPLNILYIHSHDTGRLIEPCGAPVSTPNLKRLTGEGILFRNAFCASPSCSPSRGAMLTGQYPHTNGLIGLTHRGEFRIRDLDRHLVRNLRNNGYKTVLCGIQHEGPRDLIEEKVYDVSHRTRNDAGETASAAAGFLESEEARAQPFFLSVGFFETHRPFPQAPPEYSPDIGPSFPGNPDVPELRADMAAFRTMVARLDDAIGEVIASLDRAGLAENTVILCTTDHGPASPFMKCNLTDAGLGVFMILRGPGGFSGGRVVDAMVSQLDVYPTVCELLELTPPENLQGTSLLPLVHGAQEELREELFAEVNYHVAYEPQRCVRTKRWKYVRRYGEWTRPALANIDASPSKTWYLANGLADRELPGEALYDLYYDPSEQKNLAADRAHSDVLARLRRSLDQWMEETDDPILKGPIPPPPDAELDPPEKFVP